MKFYRYIYLAVLLPFFLIGCDLSGDNDDLGTLQVLLTDAPANYESVMIDVQQVRIHRSTEAEEGESGWIEINAEPMMIDLLKLTNGQVELLGEINLEPGRYNQMRLVLGNQNEITIDGETIPLDTPSAQQSGLKLNIQAEIVEGGLYRLLLDFDASRSIIQAGASGKFLLRPVIRTVELGASGSIEGNIEPENAMPWVYAIAGQDTLAGTKANDLGEFRLIGLAPATYQVSVDPDTEQYNKVVISGVEVEHSEVTNIGTVTLEATN